MMCDCTYALRIRIAQFVDIDWIECLGRVVCWIESRERISHFDVYRSDIRIPNRFRPDNKQNNLTWAHRLGLMKLTECCIIATRKITTWQAMQNTNLRSPQFAVKHTTTEKSKPEQSTWSFLQNQSNLDWSIHTPKPRLQQIPAGTRTLIKHALWIVKLTSGIDYL